MLSSVNSAIAIGDLSTAALAAVGMQALSGFNVNDLARDFLTVGGTAVIACQVGDLIAPRATAILAPYIDQGNNYLREGGLLSADMENALLRAGIAAVSSYALFWAAGMAPADFSLRSLAPSAVVGVACVGGHYVSGMAVKRAAEQKQSK